MRETKRKRAESVTRRDGERACQAEPVCLVPRNRFNVKLSRHHTIKKEEFGAGPGLSPKGTSRAVVSSRFLLERASERNHNNMERKQAFPSKKKENGIRISLN